MSKPKKKSLKQKTEIEDLLNRVSIKRDELRELEYKLEEVLESVSTAHDNISQGISLIQDGLEEVSQYL